MDFNFVVVNSTKESKMYTIISETEFFPGTTRRRIYVFDDNGDYIMTSEPLYEIDVGDDGEEEEDDGLSSPSKRTRVEHE